MTLLDMPAIGPVAPPVSPGVAEVPPRVKRWTKAEFYGWCDRGFFEESPIFLYRGALIEVPPMGPRHAQGVVRISQYLFRTFDPALTIRIQLPFETPGETVPLPDGAAITPDEAARLPHPNCAALLVEVADSSVELDREKAFDYAAALVPDYWLVNLRDGVVEAYRDPVPDTASPTGYRYASHRVYPDGESLAPLARPDAVVDVATLTRA
jgi:Uma2 family endonuclease